MEPVLPRRGERGTYEVQEGGGPKTRVILIVILKLYLY
jgi:hypothetical protein